MAGLASSKILVVMNDLFFSAKINDCAKRLGMTAEFVKDQTIALEKIKASPVVAIFDLNCSTVDLFVLIRASVGIPTIGFVSHVQTDLRQKAVESGCAVVVARSAFAQNLDAMLMTAVAKPVG